MQGKPRSRSKPRSRGKPGMTGRGCTHTSVVPKSPEQVREDGEVVVPKSRSGCPGSCYLLAVVPKLLRDIRDLRNIVKWLIRYRELFERSRGKLRSRNKSGKTESLSSRNRAAYIRDLVTFSPSSRNRSAIFGILEIPDKGCFEITAFLLGPGASPG